MRLIGAASDVVKVVVLTCGVASEEAIEAWSQNKQPAQGLTNENLPNKNQNGTLSSAGPIGSLSLE